MNSLGFEFPVEIEGRSFADTEQSPFTQIELEDWAADTEGYGINLTEDDGPPDTKLSRHLETCRNRRWMRGTRHSSVPATISRSR